MFPIEGKKNKRKIQEYLDNILKDNVKRRVLKSDGTYEMVEKSKGEKDFDYQEYYITHKF
jgi:polyphosphate kinase